MPSISGRPSPKAPRRKRPTTRRLSRPIWERTMKVNGIDVFYGDLQVLWDVSFEVRPGEIVVLVGANGAGKSTVIKTVSALIKPRKGSVEFDGVRIDQIPAYRVIEHGIVHVPEGRRLFTQMSVEENLIMGSLHGEAKTQRFSTMERVYQL